VEPTLRLGHLYPKLMNIYGDRGNILCLERRCRERGIGFQLTELGPGDKLKRQDFDMLFIGPSDLAASAGHVGHPDDPAVLALIEEAIAATKAAGRALGSIPLPGRRVEAMLAGPFDFVISASDVALLRLGAQADVSAHRRA